MTKVRDLPPGAPGAVVLGGDYQGLGIVRSLGRQGVPVIVVDDQASVSRASRWCTRSVRVPSLREPQEVLRVLRDLREREEVQGWVLFPTRDEMVAALSHARSELAQWYRVPTPPWAAVEAAWDKRKTYRTAQRLAVPTPRTWTAATADELDLVDTTVPLVVKPAIKEHFFYATGVKAWRADGPEQLRAVHQRACLVIPADEVLVQELIPGGGCSQLSFCVLFRDGEALASMATRRLRQHPTDFGRASTFVETIDCPEVEEASLRFLRDIDFYGLVELEFKHDARDGKLKLLDVNPRTWGYHSLGLAAGVDFPYLLYRDQMGKGVKPVRAAPGQSWVRLLTDVPNAARDLWRRADRPAKGYVRSLLNADAEAVFSFADPLPGLLEVLLLPRTAVSHRL